MNLKNRFSIPYNGDNYKIFCNFLEQYSYYIDSVYIGFQYLYDNHFRNPGESKSFNLNRELNTIAFCSFYKGKKLLCLNDTRYPDYDKIVSRLFYLLSLDWFNGVITNSYSIIKLIHYYFPKLEIHLSCNSFSECESELLRYKEIGTQIFNVPRRGSRDFNLLKKYKSLGLKTKLILNETCMFGCPQQINDVFHNYLGLSTFCREVEKENKYKTNLVIPRWLPKYDQYIDIFKIVGRGYSTNKIFKILDIYINMDNSCLVSDIAVGGVSRNFNLNLPVNKIPDKQLYCLQLDCINCKQCHNLYEEEIN